MKMRIVLSHSRCRRLTWSLWRWRWSASVVASLISWWCYHDALRLPVSITIRCQSLVSNDMPKQLQASTNLFMTGKTHNQRTGGKCPEPVAEDVKSLSGLKKKKNTKCPELVAVSSKLILILIYATKTPGTSVQMLSKCLEMLKVVRRHICSVWSNGTEVCETQKIDKFEIRWS